MSTLTVNEVNEMIDSGDIDFGRYKSLAKDAGLSVSDGQIRIAISMTEDDDDDEFIGHLKSLV